MTHKDQLPDLENRSQHDIEIFDEKNPYSIVSVLSPEMKQKFMNVDRTLLGLSESELREKLNPTPTLNKLRLAFWYEYEMCVRTKTKISAPRIYTGICLKEYFYAQACSPSRLAWLLTPVAGYQTSLEEALEFAIAQMRKMLTANIFKAPSGGAGRPPELNTATANIILNIYKLLDARIHGAVTQKIEMKKLSVSKNYNQSSKISGPINTPNLTEADSGLSIDQQIAEMEQKLLENSKIVGVPSGKETGPGAIDEAEEGNGTTEDGF